MALDFGFARRASERRTRRCVICGVPLTGGEIGNCEQCRKSVQEYLERKRIREQEEAARKAKEAAELKKREEEQLKNEKACGLCPFGRRNGNILFCMSTYGTCLKREFEAAKK